MIRKTSVHRSATVMVALVIAGAAQAQSVLTTHVRAEAVSNEAKLVGQLPANQVLTINVVLPLSDPTGLNNFLSELYNPNSANFRQFLTVQQFTERFGPSQADYDTVVNFVRQAGLQITGGTRDSMSVLAQGPVSNIEAAFHTTLQTYQDATDGHIFYGPDREPTTKLSINLWHVSGLDNNENPHPLFVKKSDVSAGVSPNATTGSGPQASFLGSDMRAAYYGAGKLTGAGQNLGLFEYVGTDLADLKTYYKNTGQTLRVPVSVISTDGTSTTCVFSQGCDDTEQTLDMTQALGMAPGLASLVMYVGTADTAIIGAMTTHSPLPMTIGCSWGWRPADPTTLDPYFLRMAAQGQNFFVASGDSSTWTKSNFPWPAEDANVVTVGGTDLVTASAAGPWKSETAWSASGGGISPDKIAIPSWQQLPGVITSTNKGSTVYRNGPDVAANANYTFYVCADQEACTANEYGGTSFAAPMWAAYIALVNQGRVYEGNSTLGFLNPIIYPQNLTAQYTTDFHDITSGKSGSYSAVQGFDLVTGWGSPNTGLIGALLK